MKKKTLKLRTYYTNEKNQEVNLSNIPVMFYFLVDNKPITKVLTDKNGIAEVFLSNIKPSNKMHLIAAEMDISDYLQLDPTSGFYNEVMRKISTPKAKFFVKVSGYSVCIETNEPTDIHHIESKLKDVLSEQNFNFVKDYSEAEYYITINAKSRRGNVVQGLYFAYVDASVSVMEMENGLEIYKNIFSNIKGGAGNYQQAVVKAFDKAANEISEEVLIQLTK